MILRFFYLGLVISTFLPSCKQSLKRIETTNIVTDTLTFFEPIELGAYNNKENLTITARFSECGEWGGHKEVITIYSDEKHIFHAHYLKYPFNCDSMPYPSYERNIKSNFDKEIVLSSKDKKAITDYLHRLIQSKITENFPGHAGNIFSAFKSDSSFLVSVYDRKLFDITSYNQLVAELF